MSTPLSISAVLLAAGESRRMGAANKLLLEIDGETILRRAARALTGSTLGEIVVVLGHEHKAVGACLDGLRVRTVINPDHRAGQMRSVRAGVAALESAADGIMVCLADQPFLEAADIDALTEAFSKRTAGSILVPMLGAARGNPVIFAASHREELLDGGMNFGCRRLIARHPDQVVTFAAANDHYLRDLDTPEAYAAAKSP